MTTRQDSSVAGRTLLVTGANRGLGQALVGEALRLGAHQVYAASRGAFTHPDARVTTMIIDVTDPDSIAAAAARVDALDVLVNNAAIGELDQLQDRGVLEQHLAVNVVGLHAMTEAFRPALVRTQGRIINLLSIASLASLPVMAAYSASKAAAFSLTQSARALLAADGVTVHAVIAGPMDTDMTRELVIPKASVQSVAAAIYQGVDRGDDEIFPDPMSARLADTWREGPLRTLAEENAASLSPPSFTMSVTTDRTPAQVFAAICDVRAWWAGEIDGSPDRLGAEFTYRNADRHVSRQKVVELTRNRRVVWRVLDSQLSFTAEHDEWTGTEIIFDIDQTPDGTRLRFTHLGLEPRRDCYQVCSTAWTHYIGHVLAGMLTNTSSAA